MNLLTYYSIFELPDNLVCSHGLSWVGLGLGLDERCKLNSNIISLLNNEPINLLPGPLQPQCAQGAAAALQGCRGVPPVRAVQEAPRVQHIRVA